MKFCVTNELNILASVNENAITLWNLNNYEKIKEISIWDPIKNNKFSALEFIPEKSLLIYAIFGELSEV